MTTYISSNPATKKALKALVGQKVSAYTLTPFGTEYHHTGRYTISGPHYPKPHRWYAQITLEDGILRSVS
jgi:hypothetical protein